MDRATIVLELGRTESDWLNAYAREQGVSVDEAANRAIRALNMLEQGGWSAPDQIRNGLIACAQMPDPAIALDLDGALVLAPVARAGSSDASASVLAAGDALDPALAGIRQSMAALLHPESGLDFGRPHQTATAPGTAAEEAFGTHAPENLSPLLDLDTSLDD